MPRIRYQSINLRGPALAIVDQANDIIAEYAAQGFSLTLRQLYYQFVARDILPNEQRSYKRLGSIINDARMGGLVDWDAIEDRTRFVRSLAHWTRPASMVEACAQQFRLDMWQNQASRPEVWIEKDALIGVIEGVCQRNDVPYFSCRGYVSQSEMWGASQRLLMALRCGWKPYIIHLGDHDPSGVDMTRDITDRLNTFLSKDGFDDSEWRVHRIALTMAQIRQFNPPPNPAKLTDARAKDYIRRYGKDSWELDALDPRTLDALIQTTIDKLRSKKLWAQRLKEQEAGRKRLRQIADEMKDE